MNEKRIHVGYANGTKEFRVYQHGELIATFYTERNAKLFVHSEDMLDQIGKLYRSFGGTISAFNQVQNKIITTILSNLK